MFCSNLKYTKTYGHILHLMLAPSYLNFIPETTANMCIYLNSYYAKPSCNFAGIISLQFLFRSSSLHGIMMIYLSVQKWVHVFNDIISALSNFCFLIPESHLPSICSEWFNKYSNFILHFWLSTSMMNIGCSHLGSPHVQARIWFSLPKARG